jgi:hypothetical protein
MNKIAELPLLILLRTAVASNTQVIIVHAWVVPKVDIR